MADERLRKIYYVAGRLFNRKLYANTQVAEIAAEAGIATGSMYTLFAGKKAVLTFVIRASLEKGYLDKELALPLQEDSPAVLQALADAYYQSFFGQEMCIANEQGDIVRPFPELMRQIFDMNAETLLATNNIESNADKLPALADAFFAAREQFFGLLEENLRLYEAAGIIRPLTHRRLHVQSIVDILTWWAMNAYVALPDQAVPRDEAREIAVGLVVRAYAAD